MKPNRLLFILGFGLIGCSSELPDDVTQVENQLTVLDVEGIERQVFSSELFDEKTGEPAFPKVFVIDREARKKGFVEVEKLQSQNPSRPRYFPVTQENPNKG